MQDHKGYIRLPVRHDAQRKRITLSQLRSHEIDNPNLLTGTLRGVFTLLTPLHVGSGIIAPVSQLRPRPLADKSVELAAAFYREGDQRMIPGSSLKGSVRSLYEMVTYSCLPQARGGTVSQGMKACTFRADNRVPNQSIELCPACRVFGGRGYTGQIFFHASPVPEEVEMIVDYMPQRWEPRLPDTISRKLYTHEPSDDQRMEPHEMLPVGTQMPLRADFRNLAPEELGVLMLVLGQDSDAPLYPKFGGLKAHGYGAVEINLQTVELVAEADYLDYHPLPHPVPDWPVYIRHAYNASDFDEASWRAIVSVLGSKPGV